MSTPSSFPSDPPPSSGRARRDSVSHGPGLSARDAAAVDRMFGDESAAAGTSDADPAARLSGLLRLLEIPDSEIAVNRELMVDLTLARVSRASHTHARDVAAASFVDGDLSPDDDDALEALVEAGMDVSRVPASLRARASRQFALLNLLEPPSASVTEQDLLVTRTLASIQEHIERDESRMVLAAAGAVGDEAVAGGFRPRFRLSDLVTAAALILIGFGVLAPITNAVQGYSRRMDCQANLSAAGLGFGLYAGSNKDALPMATASPAGRPWWFVGRTPDQSNAANLYTLVRTGNATLGDLACAGNEHGIRIDPRKDAMDWSRLEEVSYSYQNLFARERPNWSASTRTIVLIDRSPVILKAYQGRPIDPIENSPNHSGRGQSALYNDGSVEWLRSPVLQNGDNIWLPRRIEHIIRELTRPRTAAPLKGTESPDSLDDVFVGP